MSRVTPVVSLVSLVLLTLLSLIQTSSLHEVVASSALAPSETGAGPLTAVTPYLVFERLPGPDVPTLQELTAGATTDEAALRQVVSYYDENKDRLQLLWREDNPTRLAAIYAMYVVHITHVYGETPDPTSFLDFVDQTRAHCGTYSFAERQIASALGLTWREVALDSGWHGWIEVQVDGQWETFDATTNMWIDHGGFDLKAGGVREYRYFYTPMLDIDRVDARWHIAERYNMQTLRLQMPAFGITYNPPGALYVMASDNLRWSSAPFSSLESRLLAHNHPGAGYWIES